MKRERVRELLKKFKSGEITENKVLESLKALPFEDLGFAKVDHHRAWRCGQAEVIFCQGKTSEQVQGISEAILAAGHNLLATRATAGMFDLIHKSHRKAQYHASARTITVVQEKIEPVSGSVVVVSGGTADIPVAEEARITAEMTGSRVTPLYDVGVAGLHRVLHHLDVLSDANVIVVVAGMEGALASVVAGLVAVPVIGVPTSVGYGASFGGLAPLLTMLNSCAAGVSVVNIDNGFGGGYTASLINAMASGRGAKGNDA